MHIKQLRSRYKMFLYNLYSVIISLDEKNNKIKRMDYMLMKSELIYTNLYNELFFQEIARTDLKVKSATDSDKSILQALSFYIKELEEDINDIMKVSESYIPSTLVKAIHELPSALVQKIKP